MVGLGNVNNTADADKPISSATQTALDGKAASADLALKAPLASPTFTGTVSGITAGMVGLGNVNNTADADKPISSATQTALDGKAASADLALKAPLASPTFTGTVSGITAGMVGLGNVNNTADADKPISSATQTALDGKATTAALALKADQSSVDLKAPLASPTFTGTVTAPTFVGALSGNATTATTAGSVTTNANLTGPITSVGNATSINSQTGTGNTFVMNTSPTLVTPNIGAATGTSLTASGNVSGSVVVSTVSTGTAPFTVTSTTPVANLSIGGNAATATTAGSVTTNANLTGPVTSVGNATSIANGAISNAMLANAAVGNLSGTNTGDQTATTVANVPAGNIAATTVQAAINELDTEKANLASPTFTGTVTLPTGTIAVTQSANNNSTAIATTAYADAQAVAAKLVNGSTAGDTPYWNGTAWVAGGNIFNNNGNVGIGMDPVGAQKLQVNGKVKSNGINETSDERWKTDIKAVENALPKVLAMRGVNYNWRTGEFPEKNFASGRQLGLIAQEVEKVIPEVVDTDDKGFKSVEYSKLVALLLEAIKDQQKLISKQEADIASLKSDSQRVEKMEAELVKVQTLLQNLLKGNVSAQHGNVN